MYNGHSYFNPKPIPAQEFAGSVIPVTVPEPKQPQAKPALEPVSAPVAWILNLDGALSRLASIEGDPEVNHHRDALITDLRRMETECNNFLRKHHAGKVESLRAQHAEIVPQCRAAKEEIERVLMDMHRNEGILRDLQGRTSRARVQFMTAQGEQPAPEDYATDEEISRWQAKCDEAREALITAEQAEQSQVNNYQALAGELQRAQKRMKDLAEQEADLRTAMAGKPVRDRVTGLFR
jgi:chromosome segregation ATPase